ncbi:MAG: hypothetical protein KAR79_01065, partial [Simkaniaceae bacterium]|nr:hypothetical protein [Simkaniaceae bacterium]
SISDDLEERKQIIENIFFSFLFMGEVIYAKNLLDLESLPSEFSLAFESQYAEVKDPRLLTYLFEKNLNEESAAAILPALIKQPSNQMHAIWVHLLLHQMENAHKLLKKASPKEPLYNFLYGIYLLGTEGVKSCHNYFKQAAKISNPPTHRLLEQFLCGHITLKKSSSRFSFENKKLFQQLALYNKISEDLDKSLFSRSKLKKHLLLLK